MIATFEFWLTIILIPPSIWAATLVNTSVHEAGHVIAGFSFGRRWRRIHIRPILLQREEGDIRVSNSGTVHGGLVDWDPASPPGTRVQAFLVHGAGCLANVILACTVFLLLNLHWITFQPLVLWFVLLSVISSIAAVQTLVPYKFRIFDGSTVQSDGLNMIDIIFRPEKFRERKKQWQDYYANSTKWEKVKAVYSHYQAGKRPRDLDPDLVQAILSFKDGTESEAYALSCAYVWAIDTGNWERESDFWNTVLAIRGSSPEHNDIDRSEKAYCLAMTGTVKEAKSLLEELSEIGKTSTFYRASAAIAMAEGRLEEAAELAARSKQAISPQRLGEYFLLQTLSDRGVAGDFSFPMAASPAE